MSLEVLGEERGKTDHGYVTAGSQYDTQVDRITADSPHGTRHIWASHTEREIVHKLRHIFVYFNSPPLCYILSRVRLTLRKISLQ